MTLAPALWLLLGPVLPGFAQDEMEARTAALTVDAMPYLSALQQRFTTCLAEEGTVVVEADEETLRDTLRTIAPLMPWTNASSCTASDAAVAECAAAVASTTCALLGSQLEAALRGETGAAKAAWAIAYGDAVAERVGACFAAETGRALTTAESNDLDGFRSFLGQTLESVASSCPVDTARAAACTASIGQMRCETLATALANDSVELLVTDFVSGCEGFLDCGG